ncbi:MAG: hypothetical protein ACT4O2_14515 [Beijerinckiaceae bacterium]
MEEDDLDSKPEECAGSVTSVARTVFGIFSDELAKVEGLSEIAPKLRKGVLDDGVFSEPAVRAGLFSDTP